MASEVEYYRLCYGKYALSLPHNHFLSYAVADSFALARARKTSWNANLARILQNLSHPVIIYLARQWLPDDIDNVVATFQQSRFSDIESFISEYSKALLLLYITIHYHTIQELSPVPRTPPAPGHKSMVMSYRSHLLLFACRHPPIQSL